MIRDRHAVVWGASGAIGGALVDALASSGNYAVIHAGSRTNSVPASNVIRPFTFDLRDEASIIAASLGPA